MSDLHMELLQQGGAHWWHRLCPHSHTNIDTTIGNTRIVCNQLGYVYYNEYLTNGFEPNKVIPWESHWH